MVKPVTPDTSGRRPGGRTARVRERTLQATVELVALRGISGLRYEDVAERAGVSRTSVYRNWPQRGKLVSDALSAFAEDAVPMPDSGDIRADLVQFLVALVAAYSTPLGQALVQALGTTRDDPEVQQTVNDVFERRLSVLRRRLDRGRDRGELPDMDVHFLAEMLTGPVHMWLLRGTRPFTRADAERISDVVLAGIRAVSS
ncbi:TetR/AcrR family transcriptional regulator [Mycobacterium sp. 141]|uniref:TetR/AcrR family transcriptional regulator n=1 Tax=Mycobacterium sp. 141 TaxID=1120797 RepID=UPI000475BA1E|nr:TetR/AcrR family transcriptional regulator [Mycobacterium sp. 141]